MAEKKFSTGHLLKQLVKEAASRSSGMAAETGRRIKKKQRRDAAAGWGTSAKDVRRK